MQRNLKICMLAVLAFAQLVVLLGLFAPQREILQDFPDISAVSALKSLNSKNSCAKSVMCPNIKMGLINWSSLYYEKESGDMLFSTWVFGVKEADVACSGSKYWFWVRSFDRKSFYFCDKGQLDATRLNPLMRPEVIAMISWIEEIDPSSSLSDLDGFFIAEQEKGDLKIITKFSHDRVLSKVALRSGVKLVTLEGKNHNEFNGLLMPTTIKATWHEENLSSDFTIKNWQINPKKPTISEPKDLEAINFVEDFVDFSSGEISESSFFSPIPACR